MNLRADFVMELRSGPLTTTPVNISYPVELKYVNTHDGLNKTIFACKKQTTTDTFHHKFW